MVRAYKNWALETKRITSPEIVMNESAHPAINKAGKYFGVKIVMVKNNPETLCMDLEDMEDAINSNTIAIIGSTPSWPHGVVDDIPGMGKLALKYNIGLHVDNCFGSFIMPFLEATGRTKYKFDYRIPGVTSLSCD